MYRESNHIQMITLAQALRVSLQVDYRGHSEGENTTHTHLVPLNVQVYELLTVFMDWISDHHLSKLKNENSGMD
ncbi:hypothetical protein MC885_010987, partial [Smutsia gigantea]